VLVVSNEGQRNKIKAAAYGQPLEAVLLYLVFAVPLQNYYGRY
jgi:hypothetical protein